MKKTIIIISVILILFSVVSCTDSKMGKLKITIDTNNVDFNGITKANLVIQTATKTEPAQVNIDPKAGIALKLDDVKKGSVTVVLPVGAYDEGSCYITLSGDKSTYSDYIGPVVIVDKTKGRVNPFVIEKNKTLEATCVLEESQNQPV